MDTVFIERLEVETVIGIHDYEREMTQPVLIDLQMAFDIREAAADDSINEALDYQAVAERVTAFVAASRFMLVETLAEETARTLLTEFDLDRVTIRVSKPDALANAAGVGVMISRSRDR